MIKENKLDKVFGPFGSSTGFFMIIGGAVAMYYSMIGIIIAVVGAFVAFTTTSSFIDTENRRIKLSNNLFGFIRVGKWIHISSDMKIGLRKSHRGYQAYIRGTQPVSIHNNDIRIFLFDSANKQIMPVQKFSSPESSRKELYSLSTLLELDIV